LSNPKLQIEIMKRVEPTDFQKQVTFNKFQANWMESHTFFQNDEEIEQLIQKLKSLENDYFFHDDIISIMALKEFIPRYVSPNIERILGYSNEEFINFGPLPLNQIVVKEHLNFLPDLIKSQALAKENNRLKNMMPTMGEAFVVGLKVLTKNKEEKKLMIRKKVVYGPNYQLPEASIFYYTDITHLLKTDHYWFLGKYKNTETTVEKFVKFGPNEKIANQLISKREKEILNWVIKGKSSKEISKELDISQGTVEKHRKNMIARLGVRDTSSLIQVCKFCEIF